MSESKEKYHFTPPAPSRKIIISEATQLKALDDEYKRGLEDACEVMCPWCDRNNKAPRLMIGIRRVHLVHGVYEQCLAEPIRRLMEQTK